MIAVLRAQHIFAARRLRNVVQRQRAVGATQIAAYKVSLRRNAIEQRIRIGTILGRIQRKGRKEIDTAISVGSQSITRHADGNINTPNARRVGQIETFDLRTVENHKFGSGDSNIAD